MSRQLTVSALWRSYGHPSRPQFTKVPHLRLSGRWLEAAGFSTGAAVKVRVDQGQLVITAAL
jgi:toxic protein SymE